MGILILGAGGFAREVFWNLIDSGINNIAFVDDSSETQEIVLRNTPYHVIKNWDFSRYPGFDFIVGVGNPGIKRLLVERAHHAGLQPAATIIHPKAIVQDATIGKGGIIAAGCVITTNVRIGNYVGLNLNCTVGHDANIHDFVQVNPGCHISGNVTLEEEVSLGTGTTVIEGVSISKKISTGAQAAVVNNLSEKGTYVGVPAKAIKRN